MKPWLLIILWIILFTSCRISHQVTGASDIVIKDVNLITMASPEVQEYQSVYVSQGTIREIGPFEDLNFPEDSVVINAEGQFLLPGFSDMHTHTYEEEQLTLYLANGVTTIRNMWGTTWHLQTRKNIEKGRLLSPNLYTAGPLTDGENAFWVGSYILTDPEKAEDYVLEVLEAGYDYVKVYDKLSEEVFFKIMEAANAQGIPVVGHVPQWVSIEEALSLGMQSIEHFRGYDYWNPSAAQAEYIEKSIEAGVWNCPTLVMMESSSNLQYRDLHPENYSLEALPELIYVNPNERRIWESHYGFEGYLEEAQDLLHSMNSAGARMVSGTDVGVPYLIPGFSLHREFELMHQAGLTNYEVLQCTTVNAAKMLGIEEISGTIEVGKNADLVLLNENPLENISHSRSIAAVMIQGRWLDKETLDIMLDQIANRYSSIPQTSTERQDPVPVDWNETTIPNGDFSQQISDWGTNFIMGGLAEFRVVDQVMEIEIEQGGTEFWSVGLYSENIPLAANSEILVSFDIKADGDIICSSNMGMARRPWTFYGESGPIELTGGADWQTISYRFTMKDDDPRAQLAFALGRSAAATVYIDNVKAEVLNIAE